MKLRRLEAYVERGQPARLLAGALSAVERAAVEVGLSRLVQLSPLELYREFGSTSEC